MMNTPNPSLTIKNLLPVALGISAVFVAMAFANVFFIGEGYHNGIRAGKIFFLLEYSTVAIPVAAVLLLWRFRQPMDWLSIILTFFLGWILAVGREGGIWQDERAWYFFPGIIFFILVRYLLSGADHSASFKSWTLTGLAVVITAIAAVQATLGEMQVLNTFRIFHATYKVTGTFFNPAPYAGFLIASLPYSLFLVYLPRTRKWHNVFHWIGFLSCTIILAVLPATQSRAGWIGLFAACSYYGYHQYEVGDKIKNIYQAKKGIVLTGSFTLFLIMAVGFYGLYTFKKDSADGRLLIWKASGNILKQNPLTGTGFNTFQAHYATALSEYFSSGRGSEAEEMLAGNVQWAFNEPLQFGVELGIPGAILYLGLVLAALFLPVKEKWNQQPMKMTLQAARSSLIAIFTFGLFSYPFYSASITLLFFFSLSIVAASLQGIRVRPLNYVCRGAMLIFLIVAANHTYGKVPERKHAYWLWDEAESLYRVKAYETANESFEEALPVLQTHGLFMQQYGKGLQMRGNFAKAKEVLEQSGRYYKDDFWYLTLGEVCEGIGDYAEAEQYYKTAASMVPHKLYPRYLLARLYDANGQMQEAETMANDILTSDVKVMSTAVEEIQQEMRDMLDKHTVENGNKEEPEAEPQNSQTSGSGVFTRHNDDGGPSNNGKEVQR